MQQKTEKNEAWWLNYLIVEGVAPDQHRHAIYCNVVIYYCLFSYYRTVSYLFCCIRTVSAPAGGSLSESDSKTIGHGNRVGRLLVVSRRAQDTRL